MFMNEKSGTAGFYGGDKYSDAGGFVEPCRMGQGIGAELIRTAMLNAHQSGIEVLHIDADPNALGFYRSLGAQEVAAVPAPIENAPDRVRPQLRLPTRGA